MRPSKVMMGAGDIAKKSAELRESIFEAVVAAGKGHLGGAFSCVEILGVLFYGEIMDLPPKEPDRAIRDRFILSKGHAGVCLYSVLADLGYFSKSELDRICQNGALLGEHPDFKIPGVECNTGSLGHGIAVGAGTALSAKLSSQESNTFVLVGDGECQEGSVWEAAMFATNRKLDNLTVVVDNNRQMTLDYTDENYGSNRLAAQFQSFGWHVSSVDGHNIGQLSEALASKSTEQPNVVIANTTKGKGVSFMEGQLKWHHGMPNEKEIAVARRELKKAAVFE